MDDLELFARWVDGNDGGAGQELFARHHDAIFRFFENKILGEAFDLTQRTWLKFIENRHAFRRESSVRTYLFTIARTELLQELRKKSNRTMIDFDSSSVEQLTSSLGRKLDMQREKARLHAALRSLSVDQQTVLELRYWWDLSVKEVAEVLQLNENATRQRLHRARLSLKERLAADDMHAFADDRIVSAVCTELDGAPANE